MAAISRTVLGGLLAVVVAGRGSALAQGAAEAALTHSLSTATTTSAATSLGRVTNQLAGKTGQRVSTTVVRPGVSRTNRAVERSSARRQTATLGSSPGGPLIQSIQGAEPEKPPCTPAADAKPGETAGPTKTACSLANGDRATHPTEITLTAPH